MKTSENGYKLIKHYEGLRLNAYDDGGGVITIGYGTTLYPNGHQVKLGDVCTEEEANEYLHAEIDYLEKRVSSHFKVVNQNQFDALVSFAYNLGFGALLSSTLRRMILQNVNNPAIGLEWAKWKHMNRKVIPGLVKRRLSEYTLYSTGKLDFNE